MAEEVLVIPRSPVAALVVARYFELEPEWEAEPYSAVRLSTLAGKESTAVVSSATAAPLAFDSPTALAVSSASEVPTD